MVPGLPSEESSWTKFILTLTTVPTNPNSKLFLVYQQANTNTEIEIRIIMKMEEEEGHSAEEQIMT